MAKSNEKFSISNFVLVVITIGTFISIIAEIFIPSYKTNPLLYATLGTVAGLVIRGQQSRK